MQGVRGDYLYRLAFLLCADDDAVVLFPYPLPICHRELFELFKTLCRQPFGIFQIVLMERDVLRVDAVDEKERDEQQPVCDPDREPVIPVPEYSRKIVSRQCEQERHEHAHTDGDKYSYPYPSLPRSGLPMSF